jgi:NAD(P)H dehydrogenase (quinone)
MSIVIAGASGKLGRLTAEAVLDKVPPSDLLLVSRTPELLDDFAERGAVVRQGDFDVPAVLRTAFAGGERLLLISTDVLGRRVERHGNAIDAAVAAGVKSMAYTSILNPSESNPVVVAEEHRGTEELIRASGLEWTFLRNSLYIETLLPVAVTAVRTGTLLTNEAAGLTSYVSRDDCAAAAAAVLTTDGHERKTYDITGSEALSAEDLAVMYGEAGEVIVRPEYVDDEAWIAAMIRLGGLPEPAARAYATFGIAARRLYLAAISTTVEDLTGRPPRRVVEVLKQHHDELRPART